LTALVGGKGGSSYLGGGGKMTEGAGVAATGKGAGGSGGVDTDGGQGTDGIVIVWEFYT
jgi:hypothetical protein